MVQAVLSEKSEVVCATHKHVTRAPQNQLSPNPWFSIQSSPILSHCHCVGWCISISRRQHYSSWYGSCSRAYPPLSTLMWDEITLFRLSCTITPRDSSWCPQLGPRIKIAETTLVTTRAERPHPNSNATPVPTFYGHVWVQIHPQTDLFELESILGLEHPPKTNSSPWAGWHFATKNNNWQ